LVDGKALTYKENIKNAAGVYLYGDFNGFNKLSHPLENLEQNLWSIRLPHDE